MIESSIIAAEVSEVIDRLINLQPRVVQLSFFQPAPDPTLQERSNLTPPENEIVDRALRLRTKLHIPFWDAAMLSSFDSEAVPVGLLHAALFHNSDGETRQTIRCEGNVADAIRKVAERRDPKRIVAISSRVVLQNGKTSHIPMLDFHCRESEPNLTLVVAVLQSLGQVGTVLRSGKSYHFYGRNLMSDEMLYHFLAKALLFCPIIDRAWIAHQLLSGECGLRVSSRVDGSDVPTAVAEV